MPNYQLSKIYKIYSPSKNLIYIGSTTQTLSQRLAGHLRDKKNYDKDNTKKSYTSFIVLDCEDYKIELLEEYACNNRTQLHKKEGEYIKNIECVNKCVAGRTKKEYNKQYNIANADKRKEYRITNADKIKEQIKQCHIANADKIKEYKKQQYLKKKAEKAIQSSD